MKSLNAREYYFRDNVTGKNFSVCCVNKMTALRRAWAKAGHHDLTFIAEGTP